MSKAQFRLIFQKFATHHSPKTKFKFFCKSWMGNFEIQGNNFAENFSIAIVALYLLWSGVSKKCQYFLFMSLSELKTLVNYKFDFFQQDFNQKCHLCKKKIWPRKCWSWLWHQIPCISNYPKNVPFVLSCLFSNSSFYITICFVSSIKLSFGSFQFVLHYSVENLFKLSTVSEVWQSED